MPHGHNKERPLKMARPCITFIGSGPPGIVVLLNAESLIYKVQKAYTKADKCFPKVLPKLVR